MLFPKKRMAFTKTYQGKTDPSGYIVLDLAGMELDGVTKLLLPVADLDATRQVGDKAAAKLDQARSLLGGSGSDDDEADDDQVTDSRPF